MNTTAKESLVSRIVEVFLRGNLSILLILVSLIAGVVALLVTPREEDPQIVVPMADVLVQMPGASAGDQTVAVRRAACGACFLSYRAEERGRRRLDRRSGRPRRRADTAAARAFPETIEPARIGRRKHAAARYRDTVHRTVDLRGP